jgi:hypothetical protein
MIACPFIDLKFLIRNRGSNYKNINITSSIDTSRDLSKINDTFIITNEDIIVHHIE